jgi:hypothetical protein
MAASGVAENFLNKALPLHSSEKYRFRTYPAPFFCLCEEQAAPKSAAQRHYRPEQKQ